MPGYRGSLIFRTDVRRHLWALRRVVEDRFAATDRYGAVDRRVVAAAADRRGEEEAAADRSAEVDRRAVEDHFAGVDRNEAADRYAGVAHFAQADRCVAADRCAAVVHTSVARPLAEDLTPPARVVVKPDPVVVLIPRFVRALLGAAQCEPEQQTSLA